MEAQRAPMSSTDQFKSVAEGRTQLKNSVASAISSGDFTNALQLQSRLQADIGELREKLDIYQLSLRRELAEKYGFSYVNMFGENDVAGAMLGPLGQNKWIFIDKTGRKVVDKEFQFIGQFHEGKAIVRNSNQMGYINLALDVFFYDIDRCFNYSNGFAVVQFKNVLQSSPEKYIFIDHEENLLRMPVTNSIISGSTAISFSDGIAAIQDDADWKIFDTSGKIIREGLKDVMACQDGALQVTNADGKKTFVDKTGKELFPETFDDTQPFFAGVAFVQKDGVWSLINKQGKKVISRTFTATQRYGNGLAPVRTDADWFFINTKGESVFLQENGEPQTFEDVRPFSEARAIASDGGYEYVINLKGEDLTPDGFTWASDFKAGVSLVAVNKNPNGTSYVEEKYYIDRNGQRIFS